MLGVRARRSRGRSAEGSRFRLAELRRELRRELGLTRLPFTLRLEDGWLVLRGEVPDLALKRRAARLAARHSLPVRDALRVASARVVPDAELALGLGRALLREPLLKHCSLGVATGPPGSPQTPLRALQGECWGRVVVRVDDGIVTLAGLVPSPLHRQLCEAAAWSRAGAREVRDRLRVAQRVLDEDSELESAIPVILARDHRHPDLASVGIEVRRGEVTLTGEARNLAERRAIEQAAWRARGVTEVNDRLVVASA